MLMTRIVYLMFTLIIIAINIVALWHVFHGSGELAPIVPAALIINCVSWPLVLVIAYRVGQVTGVEYFRKVRG